MKKCVIKRTNVVQLVLRVSEEKQGAFQFVGKGGIIEGEEERK